MQLVNNYIIFQKLRASVINLIMSFHFIDFNLFCIMPTLHTNDYREMQQDVKENRSPRVEVIGRKFEFFEIKMVSWFSN